MCGWRIHPVTCIKPLKFEKVMRMQLRGSGMMGLARVYGFGIPTAGESLEATAENK
jgi:hypothetical protein